MVQIFIYFFRVHYYYLDLYFKLRVFGPNFKKGYQLQKEFLLFKILNQERSVANRPARGVGCSERMCEKSSLMR